VCTLKLEEQEQNNKTVCVLQDLARYESVSEQAVRQLTATAQTLLSLRQ
jgi:hypothetical protein